jgi:hypothetical protein
MDKPYSQACENNRIPILKILSYLLNESHHVLEIGTGNGQHSVYFAPNLPHCSWQPSDRAINHAGINLWIDEFPADNLARPLELDVSIDENWTALEDLNLMPPIDAVFTANTAHIMSFSNVEKMFFGVGKLLPQFGLFLLYGPFNRLGEFTSPSNERFNHYLQSQDSEMGIRNDADIFSLASVNGLILNEDIEMPANNRILFFQKS